MPALLHVSVLVKIINGPVPFKLHSERSRVPNKRQEGDFEIAEVGRLQGLLLNAMKISDVKLKHF